MITTYKILIKRVADVQKLCQLLDVDFNYFTTIIRFLLGMYIVIDYNGDSIVIQSFKIDRNSKVKRVSTSLSVESKARFIYKSHTTAVPIAYYLKDTKQSEYLYNYILTNLK